MKGSDRDCTVRDCVVVVRILNISIRATKESCWLSFSDICSTRAEGLSRKVFQASPTGACSAPIATCIP